MKIRQAYYFLRLASCVVVLLTLASPLYASEEVLMEQRQLVQQAVGADIVNFLDCLTPITEPALHVELLSELVQTYELSSEGTLETKIDWLLDVINRDAIDDRVKAELGALYQVSTLPRFRAFVEGIQKNNEDERLPSQGAPPPRSSHVSNSSPENPYNEAMRITSMARFNELLKDKVSPKDLLEELVSAYGATKVNQDLFRQKISACIPLVQVPALSVKDLTFFIKQAENKNQVWPASFTSFVEKLKADQRVAHLYAPPPVSAPKTEPTVDKSESDKKRFIIGLVLGSVSCALIWWLKKRNEATPVREAPEITVSTEVV